MNATLKPFDLFRKPSILLFGFLESKSAFVEFVQHSQEDAAAYFIIASIIASIIVGFLPNLSAK